MTARLAVTARLAPMCPRCRGRHCADLPCWSGRYARRVVAAVLAVYGDTCCHCHTGGARSAEHVRPRSRGGTDDLDNLRPTHLRCGQRRGVRPMTGWTPYPTTSRPW